jgi:hypothetical protein
MAVGASCKPPNRRINVHGFCLPTAVTFMSCNDRVTRPQTISKNSFRKKI